MVERLLKLITSPYVNYDQVRHAIRSNPSEVNSFDKNFSTPLHKIAHLGLVSIANLLVVWGAEVNTEDHLGRSPLHVAILAKKPEMVKFLLENCALVNAKTINGLTPLHLLAIAGSFPGSVEIANQLLDYGAYPKTRDCKGLTPMDYAMANKNLELFDLLTYA